MNKTLLITLFVIASLMGGIKALLDHAVAQTLETTVNQLAPLAWVTYEDAGLSLPARLNVATVNVKPHHAPLIDLERFRLYDVHSFVLNGPLPPDLHLNLAGASVALPWPRTAPDWMTLVGYTDWFLNDRELAALGYQALLGELDFRVEREGDNTTILATLNESNVGDVELRAVLSNLPPPPWPQEIWSRLRLAELHLTYSNPVFIEKSLDFLARRSGQSRAALQQEMAQRLSSDLQAVLPTQAARELGVFIENPGQLTITLKPTQPIALVNLQRLPPRRWPLKINNS